MRIKIALSAICAMLMMSSAANAEVCCRKEPRWYVGLGGSLVFLNDAEITENLSVIGNNLNEDYRMGFGIAGTLGYRFSPYFRAEAELAYRRAKLEEINGRDSALFLTAGQTGHPIRESHAMMLNGFFDLDNSSFFTPYVGGGVGVSYIDTHTFITITSERHTLKDWVPAYQFMGGVAYDGKSNDSFPFEAYLEYRYFATGKGSTDYSVVPGYRLEYNYPTQNVQLGLRWYWF